MAGPTTPILEIGLILLAAVAAGWLARRLHLPAIVGYLAVGLGFSPFTPGYVADHEQLELLADVGVVLLLFEVGIEVDLARLRARPRTDPVGGAGAGAALDGHRGGRLRRHRARAGDRVARRACASRCRRRS